jgi:adenylate kinase family enzyme
MNPAIVSIEQLNRVIDLSPATEPTYIFLIGASGSGKSTLATKLGDALGRSDTAVAKFDDSERWNMSRWENHLNEFPDFKSCFTHFITEWISKVSAEYQANKLVLCDVNAEPDFITDAISRAGVKNSKIVLVQPREEVRAQRLANDETRKTMDPETFKSQFNSEFSNYLELRSKQLGIARILNEDSDLSVRELASVCMQGILKAV